MIALENQLTIIIATILHLLLILDIACKNLYNKFIEHSLIIPLEFAQQYLGQLINFQQRQQIVIQVKEQSKILPSSISHVVFELFHF